MAREFPSTTRLTASDITALEARRIYGGEIERVEALAERGAEEDDGREAVTHGTARRGSVQ